MSSGTGDKLKGMAEEAAGRGKAAFGDATGDESVQSEGQVDQAKGQANQAKGDVKDSVDKAGDKLGGAVDKLRGKTS